MSTENITPERDLSEIEPDGYIIFFTVGTHVHVKDFDYEDDWVIGFNFDGSTSVYNKTFVFGVEEEYEEKGDDELDAEFRRIVQGDQDA